MYHRIIAVCLAILMPVTSATPVFSQEPVQTVSQSSTTDESEVPNVEPVVVTAYRTEVASTLNPTATEVVSVDEVNTYGQTSLIDALENVPGVSYQENSVAGPASVYIRGANASHTLVLLDGIKLNDPMSTNGAYYQYNHMSLCDIDTVEVAKGPFSSAYGSDAIGGVVQMLSRRGKGRPTVSLSNTMGSYGTFEEQVESQGAVGDASYSFGFSREDVHHMNAAEHRNGAFERDPYANTNFITRLDYDVTDEVEVGVLGQHFDSHYEYDAGANSDDDQYAGTCDQYVFGSHVKQNVGDYVSHKATFGYTDMSRNNWNGSLNDWTSGDTYQMRWDGEVNPCDWEKFQVGLDYIREAGESWGQWSGRTPEETMNTKGIFLQNILTPIENAFVSGSLRVDDHSAFGDNVTYGVSGSYLVEQTGTKVKSSFGTAFKAPSIYQLYDGTYGNHDLDPEESRTIDVGVEQKVTEKVHFGSTYFDTRIENMIDTILVTPPWGYAYRNTARAKIRGLENFIEYKVIDPVTLKLDYTYMRTEDVETGKRLARRPDHKLTFSTNVKWQKLSALFDVSYLGSRKDSAFSAVKDKEYILGSVGLNYAVNDHFDVFARLENAFDYQYVLADGYQTRGIGAYTGAKVKF